MIVKEHKVRKAEDTELMYPMPRLLRPPDRSSTILNFVLKHWDNREQKQNAVASTLFGVQGATKWLPLPLRNHLRSCPLD